MESIDEHQRRAMAEVLTEMDAVDQEDIQKGSSSGGGRVSQEEIEEELEELDNLDT